LRIFASVSGSSATGKLTNFGPKTVKGRVAGHFQIELSSSSDAAAVASPDSLLW
jgi:hypothetical protein